MAKSLKKTSGANMSTSRAQAEAKAKDDADNMQGIIDDFVDNSSGGEDNVFTMLHGYKDKDGIFHNEFEIREILGSDEEAVEKADVKSNGAKATTTLLARCVTRIGTLEAAKLGQGTWYEIIRGLYNGDQDYMMMKLREYSVDDMIKSSHVCPNPKCNKRLITTLSTSELEIKHFISEKIEFDLPKGYTDKKGNVHKTGVMRLPTGFDRELLIPVAKNNLAKAETLMLTRLMTFDDGYPIDDTVTAGLTKRDRKYLSELQQEFYFGVKLEIEVTCDTCGEEFTASLNVTNFL